MNISYKLFHLINWILMSKIKDHLYYNESLYNLKNVYDSLDLVFDSELILVINVH